MIIKLLARLVFFSLEMCQIAGGQIGAGGFDVLLKTSLNVRLDYRNGGSGRRLQGGGLAYQHGRWGATL
jgi:hypothetical protein